ncbi:hypothetical protein [Aquibaculum sediminis]|uniref:hypothetical protein n=1 Tax=Aquibaculum sediminis TaxID=3231907 RepID=UPI0034569443
MNRSIDPEPDYTHWQVLLLRDALEAYRRFTADHETGKRPLSWNALREKVWAYTDVDFGKDDLRQFVEGKKQGHGNFRVPQLHRLHAVFRFLTDEHIAMLTPDEFDNAELVGVQAPLHLSRYLVSLSEPVPIEFPRALVGQYESIGCTDDRVLQKHLQILFEGPGFASVSETHEVYNVVLPSITPDSRRLRRMISRRASPDARIRHGGWAIMTPEDNMLVFVKNIDTRENHYWKFAVEHPVWEEGIVSDLLLNRFDWPLFLDEEATTGEAVSLSAQQAATDTWHFTRRGTADNGE